MFKKNTIQKLVTFEAKGKDFSAINKELSDGWRIASLAPHQKGLYLCVLEKKLTNNVSEPSVLKNTFTIAHPRKGKYNIRHEQPIENKEVEEIKVPETEYKILEDA